MFFINLKKVKIFIILIALLIIIGIFIIHSHWLLKILFPIHFDDIIFEKSMKYKIDPYLVAAIINVESKYNEKALSNKNAKGLMQISPITGNWASEELQIVSFNQDLLYIPDINIEIGCWYINKLRKEFDNDLGLILAAYNGGSGNVAKWLKNPNYSKDGRTLHNIPFLETKKYVEKVLKYYKIYRIIYE